MARIQTTVKAKNETSAMRRVLKGRPKGANIIGKSKGYRKGFWNIFTDK